MKLSIFNWIRERRLSVIFHISFIALFVAIILTTCYFYKRGYEIFQKENEQTLARKLDLIESSVRDTDGHVLLSNISRTKSKRRLGITVIPAPPKTFYENYEPWDALRSCRVVFNSVPSNVRPLDVCAAVENTFKNGRYLYIIIRYYDDAIISNRDNPLLGDYLRLEISGPSNRATRWLLIPQMQYRQVNQAEKTSKLDTSNTSRNDTSELSSRVNVNSQQSYDYANQEIAEQKNKSTETLVNQKAVLENAFYITAYKADDAWIPESKPMALRVAGGSLIFPPSRSSERTLFFRIEYKLLDPSLSDKPKASPWPPEDIDKIILRLSILNTDNIAVTPTIVNSTFSPRNKNFKGRALLSLDNTIGTHLEPGELAEILKTSDSQDNNPPIWVGHSYQPKYRLNNLGDSSNKIIKLLANWLFTQLPNDHIKVGPKPIQGFANLALSLTNDNKEARKQWLAVATQFSAYLVTLLCLVGAIYAAVFFLIINRIRHLAFEAKNAVSNKGVEITFKSLKQNDEIGSLSRSFSRLIYTIRADSQLRQAELNASVIRKEAILREVGHEIRSPLQGLVAILPQNHRGRNYVDRMLRAVDHLLGASGPDNDLSNMPLTFSKIDLNKFLRLVEENAHYSGIDNIKYYGSDEYIEVSADESALEDAITHILDNGAKCRKRDTNLYIHLFRDDGYAVTLISNTGSSIPEDKLEEIFEYGVSYEKRNGTGLGQGLFIVRNYISRMSGTITAKNIEDGVMFIIRLPISA